METGFDVHRRAAALNVRLAEIYFQAAGLATLGAFADWAGLSRREARAALEGIELVRVTVEGVQGNHLVQEAHRDWLENSPNVESSRVVFLPFEDNLVALQGGFRLLVEPQYLACEVPSWGRSKKTTLGETKHASLRPVAAEGRVAGFWEFDPDARKVVQHCFEPLSRASQMKLEEGVGDTGRFLAEEIGHGKELLSGYGAGIERTSGNDSSDVRKGRSLRSNTRLRRRAAPHAFRPSAPTADDFRLNSNA